ncbi:MAG: hypothetical protein AAFV53_37285 [Myxococcota bacterium]
MTVRARLQMLSDDDLVGLSSRLTVRRARRDLARDGWAPHAIEDGADGMVAQWSDARCVFPAAGGLGASTCSCSARRLCRHRVRTIVYLRGRGAAPPPAEAWTPASWTIASLRKAAGRALWDRALSARAEGLEIIREGDTAVSMPTLGIRVRFIPGSPLEESVCGCGQKRLCVHRVLAAMAWQSSLPEPGAVSDPEILDRVRARAAELLAVGLDGLPNEAVEGLQALAQRSSQALPGPSRDLGMLADLLEAYQRRSARSVGRQWLWTVGRLVARLMALTSTERTKPAVVLRGRGRRGHLPAARLDLLGVGVEGFMSPRASMIRCWFLLEQTHQWVYVSQGRGAQPGMEPPSPQSLFRYPIWGEQSAAELSVSRLRLTNARLSPDGALGATNVVVQNLPEVPSPDRLPASVIAKDVRSLMAMWGRQDPPIFRSRQDRWLPVVLALDPKRPVEGAPTFDETTQTLSMPVRLENDGVVTLRVVYGPATRRLIEVLERFPSWRSAPSHLFVRFWPTGGGVDAAPISAWLRRDDGPVSLGPVSLGLGATPLRSRTARPWRTVGAPPVPSEDLPLQRMAEAMDMMESLAVEGLARAGRWRAAELMAVATRLSALGLADGAGMAMQLSAQITAASVSLRPDNETLSETWGRLVAWLTAVEEAWLLSR